MNLKRRERIEEEGRFNESECMWREDASFLGRRKQLEEQGMNEVVR